MAAPAANSATLASRRRRDPGGPSTAPAAAGSSGSAGRAAPGACAWADTRGNIADLSGPAEGTTTAVQPRRTRSAAVVAATVSRAILLGGPTALAFAAGGFFDSGRTVAGVVA